VEKKDQKVLEVFFSKEGEGRGHGLNGRNQVKFLMPNKSG